VPLTELDLRLMAETDVVLGIARIEPTVESGT
jgi:hypothetical protein